MISYKRIALGLAIAMPLAVAAGCAFAFSYTEGPAGYSSGNAYADPDAGFDATYDRLNQMYGTDTSGDDDMLSNNSSNAPAQDASQAPRLPTNIGGNR
jgi:hypothetical protein